MNDLTCEANESESLAAHFREVSVTTSSGVYPVRIGSNLLSNVGKWICQLPVQSRAGVIADASVESTHLPKLMASLTSAGIEAHSITVPSGESSKDLSRLTPLLSWLAQHRFERTSPVIALGGGVVGDLTGFVAASYLRGVPFIQVPTTLLSMVDSSVGGKTGVNLPEGKNLVGAFHQPSLVIADLDTLETLPVRERAAGMAEIIKAGIIADASLFEKVRSGCPKDLAPIIQRAVEIKAAVVAADEKEINGTRALLNFGHTLGHAIENAAGYGVLLHGEAIAVGMHAAALLSQELCGFPESSVLAIENAVRSNNLPWTVSGMDIEKIRRAMKTDKKVTAGKNRWVLSRGIGAAFLTSEVPAESVERVIAACLR